MKPNRSREPEIPSWVLMDYGDLIVHVFDEENRLFYDLERIWRDGKDSLILMNFYEKYIV